MSEAGLQGSCWCGGVRFRVTQPFINLSFCHCTSCKRISGGGGTANGRARSEWIEIDEGRELLTTYQPDEGSAKTFCSVCGANLFGGGWPEAQEVSVRLPAIDTPFAERPDRHNFVRSIAPWETLPDDGLPRYDVRQP